MMLKPHPDIIREMALSKIRIEAHVDQAQMKASCDGGDTSTAAADLLCAFLLITVKAEVDPENARDALWDHAKVLVAEFWPDDKKT